MHLGSMQPKMKARESMVYNISLKRLTCVTQLTERHDFIFEETETGGYSGFVNVLGINIDLMVV